ncbi:MAG TPA: hypothetical protein VJ850_12640 [Candidatus Limnocylindrales bacterium]|nr:hypothetical protein [Candidatus Limnocylindrales bacterium]
MNRSHIVAALAVAVLIAFVVAACGSTEHSAAPPTVPPLPTIDPTDVHAFADLESKLPAQIAGRAMVRASYVLDPEAEEDTVTLVLEREGKDATTLQMAIEYPADDAGDLTILAYRYPGMSAADVLALIGPDDVEGSIAPASVGGRQVLEINDGEGAAWAYAGGEVLYIVAGAPAVAEAAVAALP